MEGEAVGPVQGTRCSYWGVGVGVIQLCPADLISAEIGTSSAALWGHTKRDLLGQPEAAAESPTAGAAAGQGAELMQGSREGRPGERGSVPPAQYSHMSSHYVRSLLQTKKGRWGLLSSTT